MVSWKYKTGNMLFAYVPVICTVGLLIKFIFNQQTISPYLMVLPT